MRNASRLRVPFATGTGAFATAMVRAFCDAKRCFAHGFGRVVAAVLLMFLLQFFFSTVGVRVLLLLLVLLLLAKYRLLVLPLLHLYYYLYDLYHL